MSLHRTLSFLRDTLSAILGQCSLRTILIVPFVIQMSVVVGLISYFAFYHGQQAVNEVAEHLHEEVSARILERLRNYVQIPFIVNQLNSHALIAKQIDLNNPISLEHHAWRQMQVFGSTITTTYFATPQGDSSGAGKTQEGQLSVVSIENNKLQVYLADEQGQRSTPVETIDNYDPRLRPWYDAAVQAGRPTWSPIYTSIVRKTLVITATQPLYAEPGQLKAVLATDLDVSQSLTQFLSSLKVGESGQIFIMERNGLLVATSTHTPVFTVKDQQSQRILAIHSGNPVISSTARYLTALSNSFNSTHTHKQTIMEDVEGNSYFIVITPLKDEKGLDWLIVIVVPKSDFMQRIGIGTYVTMLLCIIGLALALLTAVWIARWITRPILLLNAAAQQFAHCQWEQIVVIQHPYELANLSISFNRMAERLQQSFTQLSENETRVKQFLDAIPVGVFIHDNNGELYYMNQHAQWLLGKGALPGHQLEQQIEFYQIYKANTQQLYPADQLPIIEALRGRKTTVNDIEIVRSDKVVPLEVWGVPIFDGYRRIIYAITVFQDITDRKQAEQEKNRFTEELFTLNHKLENHLQTLEQQIAQRTMVLREREQALQAVLDTTTDTILMIALDGTIIIINPTGAIRFGSTVTEIIGCCIYDFFPTNVVEQRKKMMETVIREKKSFFLAEDERDGTWFESNICPVLDENGTVISIAIFAREITERKRAELALQTSEAELRALFAAMDDFVVVVDMQGYCLRVAPTRPAHLYHFIHKQVGKNLRDIFSMEQTTLFLEQIQIALTEGHTVNLEYSLTIGKREFWHVTSISPLSSHTVVWVARDITERKRMEEALRYSERKYRNIIETTSEGFWFINTELHIVEVNQALCNMLGYTRIDILGKTPLDFMDTENAKIFRREMALIAYIEYCTYEIILIHQTGRCVATLCNASLLRDKAATVLGGIAFVTNISKQKQAEAKLQQAKQQAEQALEQLQNTQQQLIEIEKMAALGNLVAGIAHEINTPIGIGVTAASHLNTLTKELTQLYVSGTIKRIDLEKYLSNLQQGSELILRNLSRAAELIQSFKQIAVDQSSEQQRAFNLKDYLHEIVTSLQPTLRHTSHQILIRCPDNLTLLSYPGVFSHIITNLIMNSLLHALEGDMRGIMEIAVDTQDNQLILRYADNGKGIPADIIKNIFEPFFTTKRQRGGSGLGLHIVYNLVTRQLNGTIHCQSELGQGTTFIIQIPLITPQG